MTNTEMTGERALMHYNAYMLFDVVDNEDKEGKDDDDSGVIMGKDGG